MQEEKKGPQHPSTGADEGGRGEIAGVVYSPDRLPLIVMRAFMTHVQVVL